MNDYNNLRLEEEDMIRTQNIKDARVRGISLENINSIANIYVEVTVARANTEQLGNQLRPNDWPMEVCKIVEGQRYSKRLNKRQITALLKASCQHAHERQPNIMQSELLLIASADCKFYHNDPDYAKEFETKISEKLASVEARILPAPRFIYHNTREEKDCLPQVGQWNMMSKVSPVTGKAEWSDGWK